MFRNYLLIAWRNLLRHKVFSVINIAGLTLGLTTLFCIALYIDHEARYDAYHSKAHQLYRVIRTDSTAEGGVSSIFQYSPLAPVFRERIPEVEKLARVEIARRAVFDHRNNFFSEEGFWWADPEIFEMFDLPASHGDPSRFLRQPNTLVLTEKAALKYFGKTDAVGEVLRLDTLSMEVTGVLKDLPSNTHLSFTMLGSYGTLGKATDPWSHQGSMYLLAAEGSSPEAIAEKLTKEAQEASWWIMNAPFPYWLQPLGQIHLYSAGFRGPAEGNEAKYLYVFALVALIIVLSTAFNYINLATARYLRRAKEVGVRKVVGASRSNLVWQFLGESVLVSLVALLLALTLLQWLLPFFPEVFGVELSTGYSQQFRLVALFVGLAFLLGLGAGVYPALFLSRFRASQVLKGAGKVRSNWRVREGLLVAQFAMTIALAIITVVIGQQLRFLSHTELGFQKEQVLVLTTPASSKLNIPLAKQELLRILNVESVSVSIGSPLGGGFQSNEEINGQKRDVHSFFVDEDYVQTLQLQVVAGRNFLPDHPSDARWAVLVNEAMVRAQGWEEPIGQPVKIVDEGRVVGVVNDFHTGSLHRPINPVILSIEPDHPYPKVVLVRMQTTEVVETVAAVEQAWKQFAPELPLTVSFLDEQYEALYQREGRLRNVIFIFSFLAITIGALGLLGLAAFAAEQRTKEVGVRKVLGASVPNILLLLSKDFMKLVLLANLLAWPLAWWTMREWLQNYAYRIDLSPWLFVLPSLLVLLIALLTVSGQTWRAARANPVESLRSE